ncbi:MAG: GntR family transcriptional regulator [Glaciihabitans sp.]|jgi:DNA-binding GntR family transcriptional regulator|nr:GntR family transcriptional regulator [Glaciihabitans sp.]
MSTIADDRMRASDRAYLALRSEILDGDLRAGTVLGEVEQSTRLGVSRTPLREALSRLAAEGLVSPHSGRGVIVTEISAENVIELFEVRQALEEQAARLAARRRDPRVFLELQREFQDVEALLADKHQYYALVARLDAAIDDAAGNPFLVSALDGVRTHIARIRRMAHDNVDRLRDAAREHLQIIDAIVEGEETLAAHATQLHLHRSLRNILSSLERNTP